MNIVAKDAKTVELLARRVNRLAAPLVAQIPGGELSVESSFGPSRFSRPWHVGLRVHRALPTGVLAPMPLHESLLTSTDEVDEAIAKLREIVKAKSWPLDASETVAA